MPEGLKILFAGMVAGDPHQGGATWAVIQYVLGLRELGHEILLVEPISRQRLEGDSRILPYFHGLAWLEGGAALWDETEGSVDGLASERVLDFAAEADLLVNVSGMLRDERLLGSIPVRAFLDLDPGFNQVWQETGSEMGFDLHTHFLTVGQRLGEADCAVPDCGRDWLPTLPPVALRHWPRAAAPPREDAYTSVGHWRSYGSVEHEGIHYGQRAHSLRRLIDLPRRSDARYLLALGIHPDEKDDLEALEANGWDLVDPYRVAGDTSSYAEFVRGSKGELCVAKSGYVDSRSGWFSDRSACYLASGRPVVAQETGFSSRLPTGEGLHAFVTAADAAAAVETIEADPAKHAKAARELAEEYLDSAKVLPRMLDLLS
ncbi:MAG TPA: hypothetical protein VNC16_11705 [Solirubrobacterales bacterium]|nr:hypothetical protein [Solirubrobacterales bacterium]